MSEIKVGWVYQGCQLAAWQMNHFAASGLQVQPVAASQLKPEDILRFALIVLEALDAKGDVQIREILFEIRSLTFVPVLVLIPRHSSDRVIEFLRIGADRVLPVFTYRSILLAFAYASLRR